MGGGQTLSETTSASAQAHLRQRGPSLFRDNCGQRSRKGAPGHSGSQAPLLAAGMPLLSTAALASVCIREGIAE